MHESDTFEFDFIFFVFVLAGIIILAIIFMMKYSGNNNNNSGDGNDNNKDNEKDDNKNNKRNNVDSPVKSDQYINVPSVPSSVVNSKIVKRKNIKKSSILNSDFGQSSHTYGDYALSETGTDVQVNTQDIKTCDMNTEIDSSNNHSNTESSTYSGSSTPSSTSMVNKCDIAKKQWEELHDRYKAEARNSKGEILTRRALEQLYGKKFPTIRPNWLRNPTTGRNLELDGYCEELKIGFEYHGAQHREFPNDFHSTFEEFQNQVARDIYKEKICKERGIYMIIVDFTVPHSEIFEFVKKQTPEYRKKHKC